MTDENAKMFDIDVLMTSGQKILYRTSANGRERLEAWLSGNIDDREFYVARSVGDGSEAHFIRRRDISGVQIFEVAERHQKMIGFECGTEKRD
ncbi:hypothetical protein LLE49_19465 [Alicyclobacillus tolerans]|uniref:hypothetical protein n=1 Tax=Alicyclobacillus tolerans TaxID=90970 RepID=UPI001F186A4E|nr:hypothetical protein [Alicyclobacillus tolerans]MCF8566901.1 hypothetical protein [Alicyclobacillus tolerans]